jgi:hypothetical protein
MFSALDLLLGFAGLAVPAAIALACWMLVAKGSRHEESVLATRAHDEVPVMPAASMHSVAAEPVLESR